MSTGCVAPDGRVAVLLGSSTTPFNTPGVLDLGTGEVKRVPLDYPGDVYSPTWAGPDKILAPGYPWKPKVWRFRPTRPERP